MSTFKFEDLLAARSATICIRNGMLWEFNADPLTYIQTYSCLPHLRALTARRIVCSTYYIHIICYLYDSLCSKLQIKHENIQFSLLLFLFFDVPHFQHLFCLHCFVVSFFLASFVLSLPYFLLPCVFPQNPRVLECSSFTCTLLCSAFKALFSLFPPKVM